MWLKNITFHHLEKGGLIQKIERPSVTIGKTKQINKAKDEKEKKEEVSDNTNEKDSAETE